MCVFFSELRCLTPGVSMMANRGGSFSQSNVSAEGEMAVGSFENFLGVSFHFPGKCEKFHCWFLRLWKG